MTNLLAHPMTRSLIMGRFKFLDESASGIPFLFLSQACHSGLCVLRSDGRMDRASFSGRFVPVVDLPIQPHQPMSLMLEWKRE